MQWSKLKQQVKNRLSPKLADRVDLNSAGYRWHHEADGRIWLTVDGEEVVNFCTHTHWNEAKEIADDFVEHNSETRSEEARSWDGALDEARALVDRKGRLTRPQAREDLESYLNLTVEEALESDSPLHVGLGVLDRRLGKRRLRDLELPAWVPPFVSELLEIRMRSEGLDRSRETPRPRP